MGTVRFLLAMIVVVFHLALFPKVGHMAVQAFFVLSGYLMTLVMHESYGYSPAGFGRFWANRALRLYPMYLLVIVLILGVIALLGAQTVSTFSGTMFVPQTAKDWAQNLTFIYWNWYPNWVSPRLSSASWALTIEMAYYFLISLGISRYRWSTWAWFAAGTAWFVWTFTTGQPFAFGYYHIAAGALPFSLGALAWHYRAEIDTFVDRLGPTRNAASYRLIAAGLAGLLAASAVRTLITYMKWGEPLENLVMFLHAFVALVLIAGTVRLRLTGRARAWDKTLGDLSYPIYISHFLFAVLVAQVTGLVSPGRDVLSVINTLLTIPVMLVGCWLLVKLVDKPIEHMRDLIRGRRAPA